MSTIYTYFVSNQNSLLRFSKIFSSLIEPITKINFTVKMVLSSLRKYGNKTQNTLWSVLTLIPFSPTYHWRKLLKSVVTHFLKIKNCCLTSTKISLKNLLEQHFATTIFCLIVSFINKLMGVTIGSPLGQSLAKAFLAHYEHIWLNDCQVDDIFVLFRSPHQLEKFSEYLNTKHANIK